MSVAGLLLMVFLALKVLQHLLEVLLARANRRFYLDSSHQREAEAVLGISPVQMQKALAYAADRYRFALLSGWLHLVVGLGFLALGGLGLAESWAASLGGGVGRVGTGLAFFGLLGLLSGLFDLPFAYYATFVIEQRHGFNRQTVRGFFIDRLKGVALAVVLGGLVLFAVLEIMQNMGHWWWVYAWVAVSAFSLLTAWLYPRLLAPLFNKFSPLDAGELKDMIHDLARRIDFRTSGIFVMDASRRSSHGNAYFTGLFGEKRIVLFDTLLKELEAKETVAVLAHELGHFKLHHVRWQLVRGLLETGVVFFFLSLMLPLDSFYQAFHLAGPTSYGALIVFSLWFGLVGFMVQPLQNFLSRRNEFAADAFAKRLLGQSGDLAAALLKLRETSHAMPISHPYFSMVYHSHPPLLERLKAMGYT